MTTQKTIKYLEILIIILLVSNASADQFSNSYDTQAELETGSTSGSMILEGTVRERLDTTQDWDTSANGNVMMVDVKDNILSNSMIFSVDNDYLYMYSQSGSQQYQYPANGQHSDTTTLHDMARIGSQYVYYGNDNDLFVGDHDGNQIYNEQTGDEISYSYLESSGPMNNGYYWGGHEDGYISTFDKTDGSEITEINLDNDNDVSSSYFDRSGDEYFITNDNSDTNIYDGSQLPNDVTYETSFTCNNGGIDDYDADSVYADSQYIYFGCDDNQLTVIDKNDFSVVANLDQASDNVWSVDTTQNYIFYASHDGNVYVHEKSESEGFPLIESFSPDGGAKVNSVDSNGEKIFWGTDGDEAGSHSYYSGDSWSYTKTISYSEKSKPVELITDINLNGESLDATIEIDTDGDGNFEESDSINLNGGTNNYDISGLNPGFDVKINFDGQSTSSNTARLDSFTLISQDNRPPSAPSNPSPADDDSDTFSNTLSVDVSDPDADSMDVTFYGREQGSSSWNDLGTDTNVGDESTASVNWDRNGQNNMYGFDRGESYEWAVEINDGRAITDNLDSPFGFTVLNEASTSNPSPTGGESADQMQVDIDNPAVNTDGSLSGSTVEFWVDDGLETYQVNTDTVSGSSGTASISLETFDFRNEPADGTGDWFVKVNDTYSETDYSTSKYGSNTYNFSAAKPPLILSEDPSSYPIAETGVGLNPDLSIAVNDPDNSLMNVTFYQGSPGSDRLGEVQVSGGSGIATLDSSQHSLGSNPGDSFEWSIEAEDVEYNEVNQSSGTYSVDIIESPSINILSPTAGENNVNVTPSLESEITQGDNENVEVNYSVDGGGMNLSHQEVASGTSSGSTVSQSFDLEEGTQYDWEVNASLKDEFGNNIIASDSISFNVADAPSLVDSYPDSKSGLVNPELDVSFDNGNDPVRVEFYDWENEALLDSASSVTGSYSYDTSNSGSFGGEAGQTYFWYVVVEDEATGATYNSSEALGNPWEFSTSDVLDANVNVVQGDRNLNPGSANFGPSEIKVQIGNSKDLDMGEAKFYIEGSQFESISPVPVDETISADITDDVAAEDSQFDWSVEVLEDGNEIGNYSGTFTTHVVSLDWVDESSEKIPAQFNMYHSDEDTAFNYGDDSYGLIGNTVKTSVSVALPSLGYGSDDCFRVTAENSAGESSDASPPLGSGGECVGGVIP